jgi:hypothetical protein
MRGHGHCGPYHSLERLIAFLLARLALLLAFLSFWGHVGNSKCVAQKVEARL